MCALFPPLPILIYCPSESAHITYFGWDVDFINGVDF